MSNNSNSNASSGGIGFSSALLLLFIGLKLGGVIHWSWWWVMSPLWIGFAIWLVAVAIILLCAAAGTGSRR